MGIRKAGLTAAIFAGACLGGCASIVEGTTQQIFVNVTPESASCIPTRKGAAVGSYDPVSHIMIVSKSRDDMVVRCTADGYKPRAAQFSSSASAWGVTGALLLDAGIVDYSTGALNKYDATITIVLEPDGAPRAVSGFGQSGSACSHEQQVQARIAKQNGYTSGPKCDGI